MKTVRDMLAVNRRQAVFYDEICRSEQPRIDAGYARNRSANLLTRTWAALRARQQRAVDMAGVREIKRRAHRRWMAPCAGGAFLEVGCFNGSDMSLELAAAAGHYTGIDLSAEAVRALDRKFRENKIGNKTTLIAGDFLTAPLPSEFALIYAHGVLHHFENPRPVLDKILSLLIPEGLLIFTEPSAVNPLYAFLRALYRPFQSDRAWEWPFSRKTAALLEQRFELLDGFGWGKTSLPLSVICGLPGVPAVVAEHYVRLVRQEVDDGRHPQLWWNSYITACCRARPVATS